MSFKTFHKNQKYALIRRCVVAAFARESFLEQHYLDYEDFPLVMAFVRDMYYEYCKELKGDEKC